MDKNNRDGLLGHLIWQTYKEMAIIDFGVNHVGDTGLQLFFERVKNQRKQFLETLKAVLSGLDIEMDRWQDVPTTDLDIGKDNFALVTTSRNIEHELLGTYQRLMETGLPGGLKPILFKQSQAIDWTYQKLLGFESGGGYQITTLV